VVSSTACAAFRSSVVAALIFELARSAFALYLARFARYEVIYGTLGAIAAMLVWLYVSAYTIILGAALAAEYGRTHRH
jgi:membrane protein